MNTAPAYGDTMTRNDMAIARAPAPILNPLAQPGLSLLPKPYTIWAIPLNSKPIPKNIITKTAVWTGNPTAMEPKMRASTPRPTVLHFEVLFSKIPLMIFSIPTMIRIKPSMYMIVTIVIPGCINTSMDNMIAKAPRPTNTPRLQLGEFEFPITTLMGTGHI